MRAVWAWALTIAALGSPAVARADGATTSTNATTGTQAQPQKSGAAGSRVRVGPPTVTVIGEHESAEDVISRIHRERMERRTEHAAPDRARSAATGQSKETAAEKTAAEKTAAEKTAAEKTDKTRVRGLPSEHASETTRTADRPAERREKESSKQERHPAH